MLNTQPRIADLAAYRKSDVPQSNIARCANAKTLPCPIAHSRPCLTYCPKRMCLTPDAEMNPHSPLQFTKKLMLSTVASGHITFVVFSTLIEYVSVPRSNMEVVFGRKQQYLEANSNIQQQTPPKKHQQQQQSNNNERHFYIYTFLRFHISTCLHSHIYI